MAIPRRIRIRHLFFVCGPTRYEDGTFVHMSNIFRASNPFSSKKTYVLWFKDYLRKIIVISLRLWHVWISPCKKKVI
jgi:hypothetical protein